MNRPEFTDVSFVNRPLDPKAVLNRFDVAIHEIAGNGGRLVLTIGTPKEEIRLSLVVADEWRGPVAVWRKDGLTCVVPLPRWREVVEDGLGLSTLEIEATCRKLLEVVEVLET